MKTPQDGGAAAGGGDQEDASISAAPQQGGAASIRCLVSSIFNIQNNSPPQIWREIQGIVGYPIPWRKLGHMSLLEMVCSSSLAFHIHLEMIYRFGRCLELRSWKALVKVTSCSTPPLTSPPGTSLTSSASSSIPTGTLCLRLLDRLLDLILYLFFVQEDGVRVQPAHWLCSEELAKRPSKRDSSKDGAWRSAARS